MIWKLFAWISGLWYLTVLGVGLLGVVQIHTTRRKPKCLTSPEALPIITVIRPIKGVEPFLRECLQATFYQSYPPDRLSIRFCIESRADTALPLLEALVDEYSHFDVQILVVDEIPHNLGPNPKIRNMSRAYREAKGDVIWIVDCNVWIGVDAAAAMIDMLCGDTKHKFVHQLPLVVDVSQPSNLCRWGARLEQMFLSTSHAKFYTAINTVAVAPCIVGKSNMFRRSHLDAVTGDLGIDYFSSNICEDHLIGDLLWRSPVPASSKESRWANHGLLPPYPENLAVQPVANLSLQAYFSRRVRWLRVRKFTVTLATLVEPGTESILCSAYGAAAFTSSWTAFALFWLASMVMWASTDYYTHSLLHKSWSRGPPWSRSTHDFWLFAWLLREALALPIWIWACLGGTQVQWRDRSFAVNLDMTVQQIEHTSKDR